jgi:hypothetical protein
LLCFLQKLLQLIGSKPESKIRLESLKLNPSSTVTR